MNKNIFFKKIKKISINEICKKLKIGKITKKNIYLNDIKTLDDLADLDSGELFTLLGKKVFNNENEAGEIIMEARKHWFDEDYKK